MMVEMFQGEDGPWINIKETGWKIGKRQMAFGQRPADTDENIYFRAGIAFVNDFDAGKLAGGIVS